MLEVEQMNCGQVIKLLSKFPKNKPVKILACGVDDYDSEDIDEIDYPVYHYPDEYDEKGNPIFVKEEDMVCIFTKPYSENMFMNGV